MNLPAVLLLAGVVSARHASRAAPDDRVYPASTGPLTADDFIPHPHDLHSAAGVHAYNTMAASLPDFGYVDPYNGVPATVYGGVPFTTYSAAPYTNYNGESTPGLSGAPVTTYRNTNGVFVSTYNGLPFTTFNGAPFTNYGFARSFDVAPTPGLVSSKVHGYSFGPLPYTHPEAADFDPVADYLNYFEDLYDDADV